MSLVSVSLTLVVSERYRFKQNNAQITYWGIARSRSMKVDTFGINRKLVFNFLLVKCNLHPIFRRFQDIAEYWSIFTIDRGWLQDTGDIVLWCV